MKKKNYYRILHTTPMAEWGFWLLMAVTGLLFASLVYVAIVYTINL